MYVTKQDVYFYADISLSNTKTFIDECVVTSKLDHPNVLSLIGASINPEDGTLHMIMLFMHHGDVKSFLKSKRGNMIEVDHFPKVATHIRRYSCVVTYQCIPGRLICSQNTYVRRGIKCFRIYSLIS